jgi:hypothetical protein
MTTPDILKCPDGHFRRAIYGLGPYIADYPEQALLAAIVSGWCVRYVFAFILDSGLTTCVYPDVLHPQKISINLGAYFAHMNIQPAVSMHWITRNYGTNMGLLAILGCVILTCIIWNGAKFDLIAIYREFPPCWHLWTTITGPLASNHQGWIQGPSRYLGWRLLAHNTWEDKGWGDYGWNRPAVST